MTKRITKVCIPTAGSGKRLKYLTKEINKSLIDINYKPAISYIIEKFPSNSEFIIPLGHKGEIVKNFLKIAYPKKKFIFVKVKNFDGIGSGLGLSLLKAKKFLKTPFIFVSCDTLFEGSIPNLKKNWVGYSSTKNNGQYRGIEFNNRNEIIKFHKKSFKSSKFKKTYIGMAGIKDTKEFWAIMEGNKSQSIKIGEVFGLMGLKNKIYSKKFIWNDIGNLNSLTITRNKFRSKSNLSILDKNEEKIWFVNNQVIKYFRNNKISKNRVRRSRILGKFVPKITKNKKNLYAYKFFDGKILSEVNSLPVFKKLLNQIWNFHNLKRKKLDKSYRLKCFNFYKRKTDMRVKLFYKRFKIKDQSNIINNKNIPKLKNILEKINWKLISEGFISNFHGDLHFENIIYSKKRKTFKFLDWRQDFEGDIKYGDAYYDYAKIMHGLLVSHQMVNRNKYSIKWKGRKVHYSISREKIYKKYIKYFIDWLQKKNINVKKIYTITGLIYLNIAGLHHYPYSLFLYAIGKKTIYENLGNEN